MIIYLKTKENQLKKYPQAVRLKYTLQDQYFKNQ